MLPHRTPWCRQELPRHGCARPRIADEHRLHGTKSDARPAEQRGAANDKGLDWTLDVGHRVQTHSPWASDQLHGPLLSENLRGLECCLSTSVLIAFDSRLTVRHFGQRG